MSSPKQVPLREDFLRRFNYRIVENTEAPEEWIGRRNYFAAQYAYIRGDKNLVLHNDAVIDTRYQLGELHDAAHSHQVSREFGFKPLVHGPEKLGVLQDPTVLALLEYRWQGFELRWQKLIRKGGEGIATLWEVEFEDGHRTLVVFKLSLLDQAAVAQEIRWHDRYKGASNIVQRLDLKALSQQHRTDGRFDKRRNLETHFSKRGQKILILEYAEHGSLRDVLQSFEAHRLQPPSIVLWQLWYHSQSPDYQEPSLSLLCFAFSSALA